MSWDAQVWKSISKRSRLHRVGSGGSVRPKVAHVTPLVRSRLLTALLDAEELVFKPENLQRIGAFKFRGALNRLRQLSPAEQQKGVITHSSGNHAQAIALAAKELGIPATVVMPANSPAIKVQATRGYGAKVVFSGNRPSDREELTEKLRGEGGQVFVHPSDDLQVIYGQGTAVLELQEQRRAEGLPDLDYIFAPIGGGGLMSGTALASKSFSPEIKVIGVEPANADDAFRSMRDNKIYPSVTPNTIADGLRTCLGENTFPIIRRYVDRIELVSEEEILDALQLLWERLKMVVEPSGAVAFAGALRCAEELKGKRVGVLISGGNIDLSDFFTHLRLKVATSGRDKQPEYGQQDEEEKIALP